MLGSIAAKPISPPLPTGDAASVLKTDSAAKTKYVQYTCLCTPCLVKKTHASGEMYKTFPQSYRFNGKKVSVVNFTRVQKGEVAMEVPCGTFIQNKQELGKRATLHFNRCV